ncbi:chalcone--flavonone isomerase 2 [Vitis riparia]|uniref:chalcone--flavonone isomerase 2 n=1 Tax=Vitis riparia TaxID=96939 RepID=UPI00155AFB74|nr:chalcone--flavonone isomerase 2 [Vitis riparia]
MSPVPSVTAVQVENVLFPPSVKPPGSTNDLFLGGAGVRGLEIQGKFVKFTAIGVYLESSAVPTLAVKWKGKTVEELADSVDFFRDVVTGPFEKFTNVTTILPLTGRQYSDKVSENCVAFWKSVGIYTDAEAKAIEKFNEVLKDETFPPGNSILFTHSPLGALTMSFSKDGSLPEVGNAVIENKLLTEAVLESIIGKHGVSPEAKKSLAARLSELFCKEAGDEKIEAEKVAPVAC